MREPPLILVVDDVADNVEILQLRLESQGYEVITAGDGEAALAMIRDQLPDLVLLDIMMPKLDGIATVKAVKADGSLPFTPVILVTARADAKDVIAGIEAGADDYLTKPVDQAALMARVRAMLRIKTLHDTVHEQARRLEDQTATLALWNRDLEARVAAQLSELERVSALKRFLPPQLAEMIIQKGEEKVLEAHRSEIVMVMCDLRGFTSFAATGEPEEVRDLLGEFHAAVGPIVVRAEGTLDQFVADGIVVFFNDPLPCPDAPERAVRMAIEMREAVIGLQAGWRRRGQEVGFGVGIAQGYATLGQIGFADRIHYTAIGTVCNLASRLCDAAQDCQILVSQRVAGAVEGSVRLEEIGDVELKGLGQAVAVFNIAREAP